MANIQDYLTKILKERYGKDVRQSIHDAIQQCYLDGKAGSIDLQARESIEALESAKLDKSGDTANNITVFSSGDNLSPTGWANIEKIESGETHASLFRKFSLAVKNLRYLYKMLGTTDISAIGDGTVTGAITGLNNNLDKAIGTVFINSSLTTSLDILSTGIYSINNYDDKITDCPIGGFGMIIVAKSNNYINQLYISYDNGLYIRTCVKGTWSNWKNISYS